MSCLVECHVLWHAMNSGMSCHVTCHVMSWRHGISYHISWHVNMTSNKLNCKGAGLRGLGLQHQEPVYHMLCRMSWHVVMSRTRNVSVKRQHWYHSEWDWLGMGIQEPDPAPACAYDNTRWNLKPMWEKAVNKSGAYTWLSFDFKPFLFKDHYCKEREVWVWRHSDNYFYIIFIFEWSQVWFLASPFLGKLDLWTKVWGT